MRNAPESWSSRVTCETLGFVRWMVIMEKDDWSERRQGRATLNPVARKEEEVKQSSVAILLLSCERHPVLGSVAGARTGQEAE